MDDAIVIGSGINGLVAAALLARGGWQVRVLEQSDRPGGAIRTEELTLPGYHHDVFSGWHPLFVGGDAYAELADDLSERGLEYRNTDVPTASVLPDGTAAVLRTDDDANVAELDRLHPGDGDAYAEAMADFADKAQAAFGALGTELWSAKGAGLAASLARDEGVTGSLQFAAEVLQPSRAWLAETLRSEAGRALLAPWCLHNGLGPDDAGSGFITKVVTAALVQGGCPAPRGGGARLVDALVRLITDHGGTIETDTRVDRIETERGRATGVRVAGGGQLRARQAVLASVTPQALYTQLLERDVLPDWVPDAARRFRYGRGDMQIHLALSEPVRWRDDRLDDVAIVHVTDGLDGVSRAVNESGRGLVPARPTIVAGQHLVVDPSRAPEGAGMLWLQLQEMPNAPVGDAAAAMPVDGGVWTEELRERVADRVLDILAAQTHNLPGAVRARAVLSPADLVAANPNLVDGDPYGGDCQLDQFLLWRPLPGLPGHRTPVRGLWHIGASTHPGPGLSGASGYIVAKQLLDPGPVRRLLDRVPGPLQGLLPGLLAGR